GEGAAASGHLVEHGAEGALVGAGVERFAADLLRRHVPRRTHQCPRRREAGGFKIVGGGGEAAGDAEVENLDAAVGGEHDVLRLEVTVEDAGGVGGGQSGRHRGGDAPYLGKRQRSL